MAAIQRREAEEARRAEQARRDAATALAREQAARRQADEAEQRARVAEQERVRQSAELAELKSQMQKLAVDMKRMSESGVASAAKNAREAFERRVKEFNDFVEQAQAAMQHAYDAAQAEVQSQGKAAAARAAAAQAAFARKLKCTQQLVHKQIGDSAEATGEAKSAQQQLEAIESDLKRLMPKTLCCICYEDTAAGDGITCNVADGHEGHFICNECFSNCVQHQSGQGLAELRARDGRIACPIAGCNANKFAEADVAQHAPGMFEKYLQAKKMLLEAKLNEDVDKRIKDEVNAQLRRTEEQRAVHRAVQHIQNDVLNMHCPACDAAYADWEACAAVECDSCKGFMCGICGEKCKDLEEAHQRAAACLYGTGSFWLSKQEAEAGHRRFKGDKLGKYLRELKPGVCKEVMDAVRRDVEDNGIIMPALPA